MTTNHYYALRYFNGLIKALDNFGYPGLSIDEKQKYAAQDMLSEFEFLIKIEQGEDIFGDIRHDISDDIVSQITQKAEQKI